MRWESSRAKIFKGNYEVRLKLPEGWEGHLNQKSYFWGVYGGIWIFSGTTAKTFNFITFPERMVE